MIRVQSEPQEGRIYLHDTATKTCIVWSCESGLIERYESEGIVLLQATPHGMPVQFFVELDGIPAVRARRFDDNPFLPTALLRPPEVDGDEATVGFVYRTTAPMLQGSPAVTVHVTYVYSRGEGLACSLRVEADGYQSAWRGQLRVRFVVLADDGLVVHRYPARRVREKHMTDGGQGMRVFTWSQPVPTAHIVLGFGKRIASDAGGVTLRYVTPDISSRLLRDYADLLLTCYDGFGRLIAGFNVVEQRNLNYLGDDRDDVVAEMIAISCRYFRRFRDPRFLVHARRLADELKKHLQPDGGLTYGMSVNGTNVDYSDTDADAIDAMLQLYELTGEPQYLAIAQGLLRFMVQLQDDEGFFWGRLERDPARLYFPNQPWFTAYASVAMQQMLPFTDRADQVQHRIERATAWLCAQQRPDGSWPHDTTGSYADYDDLTNTAVAVWGLAALDRMRGSTQFLTQVQRGLDYLASLEQPEAPGTYAGRFTPAVEVLLYDYKLGYALREGVSLFRRIYGERDERTRAMRRRYARYLRHIATIQGKHGMIHGAWGSVFDLQSQAYLTSYNWYERHSSWQHYAFLGWQGKLIELFLEPMV